VEEPQCYVIIILPLFFRIFKYLFEKLDKEKNQCIREETRAQNIVEKIKEYQKKWLQHKFDVILIVRRR